MPRPKGVAVKKFALTIYMDELLRDHLVAAAYMEDRSQINMATYALREILTHRWPSAPQHAAIRKNTLALLNPPPPPPLHPSVIEYNERVAAFNERKDAEKRAAENKTA
jgi:hypothetical protein